MLITIFTSFDEADARLIAEHLPHLLLADMMLALQFVQVENVHAHDVHGRQYNTRLNGASIISARGEVTSPLLQDPLALRLLHGEFRDGDTIVVDDVNDQLVLARDGQMA